MHDEPTPAELVTTVARQLREQVVPALTGALAFEVRVAANALDLAALTGADGSIDDLTAFLAERITAFLAERITAFLAERIAAGDPALPPDALERHLLATTLARLAVDQPRCGGIARAASIFGTLPPPDQEPAP